MEFGQSEEAVDHSFQPTHSTSEKLENLNEHMSKCCLHDADKHYQVKINYSSSKRIQEGRNVRF